MKVVKVIPIAKGISKDTLSYFSSQELSLGSLVDINLRGKKKKGLVVEVSDVSQEKTNLKKEKFSLKKLDDVEGRLIITEDFGKAVSRAAKYFAASPGAVFYDSIPKSLFEIKKEHKQKGRSQKTFHEKLLLQTTTDERISRYKSLIRENLAMNKSVFVVFPTNSYSETFSEILSKGISDFSFLLNTNLTLKKQRETIEKILEKDRAVVVFMTPQFLAIPRKDLGLIIVENEFSGFYKKKTRPFIDYRKFAEIVAEEINIKIVFGDVYLRTETLWREENGEFETLLPLKSRLARDLSISIVDMKKEKKFSLFDEKVLENISDFLDENKKVFIFSARRGLHPITTCNDCGSTVKCKRCDSPSVLHKSQSGNFYLCHKCGRGREAEDRCEFCKSWNLKTLGIGSSLLEKELKKLFKGTKIFRFDGDSIKTPKAGREMMKNFYKEKKAILVGTKKTLNFLPRTDLSVVASADSFFSIPDYRISEEVFSLLLDIRFKTSEALFIQTRNKEQKVLTFFRDGNLLDFYRKEIKEREQFKSPPFSKLIKFTYSGTRPKVSRISKELEKKFKEFNIFTYPSFVKKIKGRLVYNGLIRLSRTEWVNEELLKKILELPSDIAVDVDPESIL